MQFPVFLMPYLGDGMSIALDAILHVLISHGVAIGVFGMIAWSEYQGVKENSEAWDNFARHLLKWTVVLITSVGAITGVGIWFFISVLEPRGTGALLRIFFWPWFIEWIVFTIEVIILLVYYYTWDKWIGDRKRWHLYLGFGYVLAAIMSGFLITGILGFMLTSDTWPWGQSFWSAFFNPSFLPQLLLRLSGAFGLGAILSIAFLFFVHQASAVREAALRRFGLVTLVTLVTGTLSAWWYYSVVPATFKSFATFSVLTSNLTHYPQLFWIVNTGGAGLLLALGVLAIGKFSFSSRMVVIPAVLVMVLFFIEFERIREFIRGPYIIPGYMYANEISLKEVPFFDQQGLIPNSYWFNATTERPDALNRGAYLFGQQCSVCHTVNGINSITHQVQDRSQDGILAIIAHTDQMVPFMPPFSGTSEERRLLASYLYQLANDQLEPNRPPRFMGTR